MQNLLKLSNRTEEEYKDKTYMSIHVHPTLSCSEILRWQNYRENSKHSPEEIVNPPQKIKIIIINSNLSFDNHVLWK